MSPQKSSATKIAKRNLVLDKSNKEFIYKLSTKGHSFSHISKMLNVGRTTVSSICKRYEVMETFDRKEGSGRKKKLSEEEIKQIIKEKNENPNISVKEIISKLDITHVHQRTVGRIVQKLQKDGIDESK